MKKLKNIAFGFLAAFFVLYMLLLVLFFFYQEKFIFFPKKLADDYEFSYSIPFDEIDIRVDGNTELNGLLFKADSSKGLVFYLHGNAGALDSWGVVAEPFIINNYDCFILDYRGYGKSEGEISSEEQLFLDVTIVYKELLLRYPEQDVIIVGYSIGSGPAAYLAAHNKHKRLILKAPYNNMNYLREHYYSWIPDFTMKYNFTSDIYLKNTDTAICIFHGDQDKVIPYECSLYLTEIFDGDDELIKLEGQGHHQISDNPVYLKHIERLLSE